MRRNHEQLMFSANRLAFTLVEVLIVCVIIALMAALTLIAVNKATTSAKVAKTRGTIQKIDAALQQILETYEGKLTNVEKKVNQDYPDLSEEDQQKITLHFIREMMRMEMPQNWIEVGAKPLEIEIDSKVYAAVRSPLLDYYQSAGTGKSPGRAALLFLIIQNLNPEALEAFQGSEVADTDGDGLL
jgi:type II secretory pathway pseudopilin PulG